MALSDPQLQMLRECSKDEASFQRLVELFEVQAADLEHYRFIVDNSPDMIACLDSQMRHRYVNAAAELTFGFSLSEVIGKKPPEVTLAESLSDTKASGLQAVFETGQGNRFEFSHASPDGIRHFEVLRIPRVNESGSVERVYTYARDITARKQMEAALRESETLFRAIFESSPMGIVLATPDGKLAKVNPAFARMLGYSVEELLGIDVSSISFPEDLPLEISLMKSVLAGARDDCRIEKRYIRKDGTLLWVYVVLSIIRDSEGDIRFAAAVVEDIDERKKAEAARRESEARFKGAFEFSPIGIALVSPEGKWLKVNRAVSELLGYSEAELLDLDFQSLTHPDDLDPDLRLAQKTLQGEIDSYLMEKRYIHKSGRLIWAVLSVALVRDAQGYPLYFVSQIADITERRRIEESLRESHRRYDELVANIPGVVYRVRRRPDGTSCFEYLSPRCREFNGVDAEAVLQDARLLFDLLEPGDRESYWKLADESARTLQPFRWEGQFVVNGKLKWMRLESHARRLEDGSVVWDGIQTDITAQKQAEEALRRSEEKYRLLADNSSDVIWILDFNGYFTYVSPSVQQLRGYTPEEVMRQPFHEALTPESLAVVMKQLQEVSSIHAAGQRVTQKGRDELEQPCKDGSTVWTEVISSVLYDEQGNPTGILGVSRDITERRRMETMLREQEKLQVALQKEQELSQLKSKMMVHISHEFRTPLATILSSAELVARYAHRMTDEKRQRHLGNVREQVQNIAAMLDDISLMVQAQNSQLRLELAVLDLDALIPQSIEAARAVDTGSHTFTFMSDHTPHAVMADRELMSYVITCLLSNARQYSPAGTTIHVQLQTEGDEVVLHVRDEGIGIPSRDLPRLFEPFYRGNNIGEIHGLGLGLSIVRDVVERHHGTVSISSIVDHGATFTVRLPACL